jgi:hypothetical protein
MALFCLFLFAGAPPRLEAQSGLPEPDTLASPGGKFRVAFQVVGHRTFTAEGSLRALDNVNHVEYALAFLRVADGSIAAEATYSDVYGFPPGAGPTALDVLFSWFDWSPEEDFVLLPIEGWASAPGTPERMAISLTDSLAWSRASITMDTLLWASPMVVVGGRYSDCDYAVDIFDGNTGRLRPLDRPSESPIGYEISAVEGGTVIIRRVLDNCASNEEREAWVAECRAVDLDTFLSRPVPCPARLTTPLGRSMVCGEMTGRRGPPETGVTGWG